MLTNYICVGGCEEIVLSIHVADPLLVLQKYPFLPKWNKSWWVIANGQNGCNHSYMSEDLYVLKYVEKCNPSILIIYIVAFTCFSTT